MNYQHSKQSTDLPQSRPHKYFSSCGPLSQDRQHVIPGAERMPLPFCSGVPRLIAKLNLLNSLKSSTTDIKLSSSPTFFASQMIKISQPTSHEWQTTTKKILVQKISGKETAKKKEWPFAHLSTAQKVGLTCLNISIKNSSIQECPCIPAVNNVSLFGEVGFISLFQNRFCIFWWALRIKYIVIYVLLKR